MASAWPYTDDYRAYMHCIVHHASGESFAGDPVLDPIFDWQLHAFGHYHNTVGGAPLHPMRRPRLPSPR